MAPPQPSSRAEPAVDSPDASVGRGLLPDYNRAAAGYWWLLVVAGAGALGLALTHLAGLPGHALWQIVGASLIACLVGMFPLQVPKTKTSFAAGDIFIFLLLLVHGPYAAVIAAAAETAACAWRTSSRWSSRIVGPAAAALAMLACGHAYAWGVGALAAAGLQGEGAVFAAVLAFAALYFVVSPTLVTTVIYLKRRRAPTLTEWLTTFGWLGMGYLASASIAGVLFLAFRQFGLNTVLVAVPMIGLFVTSLRSYFSHQEAIEREAAERASRERAENAEREAAMAAEHLRALEQSDRRFESAFAHAAIGMALVSAEGRLVQVNPALALLLGQPAEGLVGQRLQDHVEPEDLPTLERQVQRLTQGQAERFECELRCRHGEGREVWASIHGSPFDPGAHSGSQLIVQAFDVTARRRAERRLSHLAYHDVLTDLPNRSRLHDGVRQAIDERADDAARHFSVLHLSFDRFKQLSDGVGRGAGDQFVVAVAARMQALMRPGDLLARLEGDDFGILVTHGAPGASQAVALAERLRKAFLVPVLIGGTEVHAGASIGITSSDIGYASADDALRDAGLAMSKAKTAGRCGHALFDRSLHHRVHDRLALESDLRRAIGTDELSLAFQPIFDLAPQRLVGFEALARWRHPTRGPIPPAEFIPVAEESGLIVPLTQWVIGSACAQLHAWRQVGAGRGEPLFVNVNIAGLDLAEPGFAELVGGILDRYLLPGRCLTLEITETTLMQQLELGKRSLSRLREMDVGLSVDDFGTGYSSLSHLSTLPINSLKIDRGFVSRLDDGTAETEIVRAVIQLGQALGKRVVAEGIETETQLARLHELGCRYAQGFLLGRPQSARDASLRVARSASAAATPGAAGPAVDGGTGVAVTPAGATVPRRRPAARVGEGQA